MPLIVPPVMLTPVVSILVVLDRTRSVVHGISRIRWARLFQSLLSWIGLGRNRPAGETSSGEGVSILVVLDRTRSVRSRWLRATAGLDVSILVVLDRTRSGGASVGRPLAGGLVSILVVLDRTRSDHSVKSGFRAHIIVSILVVLDRTRSGSTYKIEPLQGVWFQSLLSWIGLGRYGEGEEGETECDVSILVVLDRTRSEEIIRLAGVLEQGFNPCCLG